MEERRVRWIVSGRVQGVGYRWFAQRAATELGVRGTVRNLRDGTVEVRAAAPPEVLAEFRARLLAGPPAARVTDVTEAGVADGALPGGFEVRS